MKKLFCVLAAMSMAFSLSAAKVDISDRTPGAQIITSSSSELELSYGISSIDLQTVATVKGDFTAITLKNGYLSRQPGQPALPAFHNLIEIPAGATPQIEITGYTEKELDLKSCGYPAPVLPQQKNSTAGNAENFSYNSDFYQTNSFNENPIAEIRISGKIRGTTVGQLTVNPIRYNPVTHRLLVLNDLRIKIRFNGNSAGDADKAAEYSPFFDNELNSLLNYRPIDKTAKADIIKSPVTYLIVANSNLQNNAKLDEFIRLKTEKGFKVITKFVSVAESVNLIDAWIEQQYATLTPKPSFVLLIGDHNGSYRVPSEVQPASGVLISDHVYGVIGAVSNTNHLPSMHVGRFSVNSEAEFNAQVDKTIWYEKTQFLANTGLDYLKFGIVEGSTGLENYSLSYYLNNTYTNPATGTTNGMIGIGVSTGSQSANLPMLLSNGAAWIHFSGYGNEGSLGTDVNIQTIDNLSNTGKYGLYIGNSGLSAAFNRTNEVIGEACMNADHKGAVGFIGASFNTLWNESQVMDIGEYIGNTANPPFSPDKMGMLDGVMLRKYSTQASIKYCGLLAVETYGGNDVSKCWSGYQLLGDPSVLIYMGVPQTLPITHQPTVIPGSPTFTVTTVKNAYVALSDEDGILHGASMTDENGIATLNIIPFTSGNAKLVVYAPMHKPLFKTLPVAPGPNGPQPAVKKFVLHNNIYAQNCFIDLELYNYGSAASNDLTVSATVDPADSVYAKVISQPVSYGNLAAADSMLVDSAITVTLSANVPDQRLIKINLTMMDSYTKRVYQLSISFNVNAPKLEFSLNSVGMILPGDTKDLIYKVKNSGHAAITDINVSLTQLYNLPITINNPNQNVSQINYGDSTDFCFPTHFGGNIPLGSQSQFKFTLEADNNINGSYTHNQLIGFNMGLFAEDFNDEWPPAGWVNDGWEQGESEGLNGTKCAKAKYTNPTLKILTSPVFDCRYSYMDTIMFWWKDDDITKIDGHDTTYCEITANGTNWTTIGILSAQSNESGYHKFCYALPNYTTDRFQIRWRDRTNGSYSAYGVGVDQFEIHGYGHINVVGISSESARPQTTTLFQNYPNPFNPETSIRFFAKEDANVNLAIYNLKGETVANLVNGNINQGFHDYKFNATGLASGVYIYKLQIGNQSMVKSMLLLK